MSCQTMLSKVYNNVAKAPNSWAIKYISTQHVSVIDRIILSENSANWDTQTGGLLASKFLLCYPRWMDLFVHGCISSLHLFFLTAYPTRCVNWAKSGAHLLYYKDETEKQGNKIISLISISVRANQSTWSIKAGKRRENTQKQPRALKADLNAIAAVNILEKTQHKKSLWITESFCEPKGQSIIGTGFWLISEDIGLLHSSWS